MKHAAFTGVLMLAAATASMGQGCSGSSHSYYPVDPAPTALPPPPPDTTAPGPVTSFEAVAGSGQLMLIWINPGDADLATVMIRRSTTAAPATTSDGTEVFNASGTTHIDTGLTDGTRYYYTAFAIDTSGNASAGVSDDGVPSVGTPLEITYAGIGSSGIFDPALATDSATGRIWMTYSEVSDSVMWPGQNTLIRTRLAYSDDAGAGWIDAATPINTPVDVALPLPPPQDAGTITHEVSSIVEDPGAPTAERWKVLWHRYLEINGVRNFQHGWISLVTAPTPTGPWSSERKLFVGSLYDPVNDAVIGPPEVQLDLLDPDLNAALVFSEPGMVATPTALYVVLLAATLPATDGRIVLLKLPHATGVWEYKGSFLVNATDGGAFAVSGFSAPELYVKDGTHYLICTPQIASKYLGTYVFEVTDLETATLKRTAGVPDLVYSHAGTAGTHNGATGYVAEATASGFIYSEVFLTPPPFFRIYASRENP